MERDPLILTLLTIILYFNSHAHVERDHCEIVILSVRNISTHTLTWSVTLRVRRYHCTLGISTHTLTWSVTQSLDNAIMGIAFQLTRSRGA